MNTLYLVPILFLAISFVFSMLGMGGSQLYIPILFWMGMDFKTQAVPLGILLNVVNSSTAAVIYARKKLVNWQVAVPFGIAMVALAPVGTWLNVQLPVKPLLVFFALFTAAAAVLTLSGWKPKQGEMSARGRVILGLTAGSALGVIAGLIGRGGGSFVVPLLYIAGLNAQAAAATSALVVTGSGVSSFVSHIAMAAVPDWLIWMACVVVVFVGSQIGSRVMANRLKPRNIKIVFGGVVLLGVAALILVKDVILAG
jgi:uncharacterized membrane protein YfcA